MQLCEATEYSWFVIEPSHCAQNMDGYVVNYSDFFQIRSLQSSTPFYFHIFKKPSDQEFDKQDKHYKLNASQEPTKLKAKLFMSYTYTVREKTHIQSGDVIRIKNFEAGNFLTTSPIEVDK
jgi:hypothetical protein